MMMHSLRRLLLAASIILTMNVKTTVYVSSQTNSVTITISIPSDSKTDQTAAVIYNFEAQNPDIHVQVVEYPPFSSNKADSLQNMKQSQQLITSADVLSLNSLQLAEATTRTGYFLNLKPLIDADQTFNPNNDFPVAWNSWSWDNGVWGIPSALDLTGLVYDPAAFDRAGLAYPSGHWTLDDLIRATQMLTERDSTGKIIRRGFQDYDTADLLYTLINTDLFDPSTIPNPPNIVQPQVEQALADWSTFEQSGLVGQEPTPSAPLMVIDLAYLLSNKQMQGSLLPNNRAGAVVSGYAVSGATQYPQQAYRLARFLASTQGFLGLSGIIPAQRQQGEAAINALPLNIQTIVRQAIVDAIPTASLRYIEYVLAVVPRMQSEGLDGKAAAEAAQLTALQAIQQAQQGQNAAFAVATPAPQLSPRPNKIALKFALPFSLTNRPDWDAIIASFIQSDSQVGQVALDFGSPIKNGDDCGYQSTTTLSAGGIDYLLNLDPLMDSDPAFNKTDFLNGIFAQVQFNNQTWSYPIDVEPSVVIYNVNAFTKAGIPLLGNSWTINQFIQALKSLRADPSSPVFVPSEFDNGTSLMLLIAAFDGLPIDYRTNPPTLNFTDQTNLDAIRQVLDLAKANYIKYTSLWANVQYRLSPSDAFPIRTDILNFNSYRALSDTSVSHLVTFNMTSFPTGSRYVPAAYSVGSAYILKASPYPDACYRWISTLAKHPELFFSMPARRSQLNDPTLTNTQGTNTVGLYKQFADELAMPNLVSFPLFPYGTSFPDLITQYFLYKAFDSYVLDNADLNSVLQNAESKAQGFQQCIVGLQPYDPKDTQQTYFTAVKNCAIKIDPETARFFG